MIEFDPATHTYKRDGKVIPGVTRVLDGTLRDLSMISREKLEKARETGTLVHDATEILASGEDLDEDSIDSAIVPYITAWKKFVEVVKPEILSCEEMVYHPVYSYAGTLDHRMIINGDEGVLDKKTGVEDLVDAVQLSAYNQAKFHDDPVRAKRQRLWILSLRPDGTYRLRKYEDHFHVFLAALTIFRFKGG